MVVKNLTRNPFQIASNTAADLLTDPASGDMTAIAAPGDGYLGAIVVDSMTVTRKAAVDTIGNLVIITTGELTLSEGGTLTSPPVVRW